MDNYIKIEFKSKGVNESLARIVVAAFVSRLDPTLDELADIKTAVSEAVTNAIIHAYDDEEGVVYITCELNGKEVKVIVEDKGKGIEDVKQAMQPLFTTKPEEERSGMGFTVMETFMDTLEVISQKGKGTTVIMTKKIK
ncbi:MAG: anti-sigma F factor [Clostridiaceae bacterium]|nr:anti-sigma F factor [Clostridiaceae bacterium]